MPRGSTSAENDVRVEPLEPEKCFQSVDEIEVALSRGFLRCAPAQWFPGLAAQWLPLSHSLVVELKVLEVKPELRVQSGIRTKACFEGTIDGDPLVLVLDEQSSRVLGDVMAPAATAHARSVMLEYLSRRIMTSFALSWSGAEASVFKFRSASSVLDFDYAGAIKLVVQVNNEVCSLWFLLGRRMVNVIDGLWRRQLVSQTKASDAEQECWVEIAQLAVPPAHVAQYVKPGTLIDLETPVSDKGVLRRKDGRASAIRICSAGGNLAIEMQGASSGMPPAGAGVTRLGVSLGRLTLDSSTLIEIQQAGALWDTGSPLGNSVFIVINGEKVAQGTLAVYQGRFAVQVR